MVQQSARFHRHRKSHRTARLVGLGCVARARTASRLQRQCRALQLALALALGQWRARQQRHPRTRVARWGLDVTFPTRVTAGGGKYRHQDDQETPDTMMVTFDFPEQKTITWEGLSWSPLGPHDSRFGISFHGTEGSIVVRSAGYVEFDNQDKPVHEGQGAGGDTTHLTDFLDAIRTQRLSKANIVEAHRSTLLCHLGNIAFRTDSVLHTNPANGQIVSNPAAQAFWSREYEAGWEPTF